MCGIVGYSGKEEMNEEVLKILLYFAEERGNDSCGVATPETIKKKAEHPHVFIINKLPVHKTVLGHTRGLTTGKATDENAHPFTQGELVGTHNGVIKNFDELQKKEDTNFKVDSEIIWYLFDKYGVEEALPMMEGFMSLAWLDEDDHLNLYRHTSPLYIGYIGDDLYYGSKEEYLEAIDCSDIESIDYWKQYIIHEGEIIDKIDLTDNKPQTRASKEDKKENKDNKKKHLSTNMGIPPIAEHVKSKALQGVDIYYWFGCNTNILYVQAVPKDQKYLPDLDYFRLNNYREIERLNRSYPELTNVREIYTKMPIEK